MFNAHQLSSIWGVLAPRANPSPQEKQRWPLVRDHEHSAVMFMRHKQGFVFSLNLKFARAFESNKVTLTKLSLKDATYQLIIGAGVIAFFSLVNFGCDEAHFWLNGYVNKQNCRIWSEANPQVYVETPLHPGKLTVWCALWAGGFIGPYFFKNDEGQIGLHPSQPWQSYARNHI
ncbi:uncharacterized protein TNCV_2552491 [Trichonephila clavipes]|nr:uncharacterized protein TNCV_2552491 [Trichonephila clavipes]